MSFVLSFAMGSALAWSLGGWVVAKSGAARNGTALDLPPLVHKWRARMMNDGGPRRIAIVGDSMLFALPGMPSLPDRLNAFFRHQKGRNRQATVHPLSWPAWSMIGQYCVADEIVAAKPDLIALELNARSLEPGPLGIFSYTEMAGWIEPRRWLEAMRLPLWDAGVTLNRLLFYRLLVAAELEAPWRALIDRQARLLNSRDPVEDWLVKKMGGITTQGASFMSSFGTQIRYSVPGKNRGTAEMLDRQIGSLMRGMDADSPRLRLLGALLRRFHEAGIPTVVWLSPINVEHLKSLGMSFAGLDHSIASVRAVVEASGAELADFHGLLPDALFRDAGDHFTLDGEHSGGAILAPRLGRALLRAVPSPAPPPSTKENAARAVQ